MVSRIVAKPAMLIDVSRCTGCRGCQVACKQWNELPGEKTRFTGTYQNPPGLTPNTWTMIKFIEPEEEPTRWLFRKLQCLHCSDASCVIVCPAGATKRREDGIIYIDQNICTGCKYCVESCPFQTPQYDPVSGTVKKCTFCLDRVLDGIEPACSKVCPTDAVVYGEREKILQIAHQRQAASAKGNPGEPPRLYGEKELGGLAVMYLLPETASLYGLPEQPRLPIERVMFKWAMGIIPGLAVLYGLWRYFGKERPASEKQSEAIGGK